MIHLSPLPDGTTLFVPFSFGHGQLELTGRGTSIVTDDLNTILRDDLEYAVATVEENRRHAVPVGAAKVSGFYTCALSSRCLTKFRAFRLIELSQTFQFHGPGSRPRNSTSVDGKQWFKARP